MRIRVIPEEKAHWMGHNWRRTVLIVEYKVHNLCRGKKNDMKTKNCRVRNLQGLQRWVDQSVSTLRQRVTNM